MTVTRPLCAPPGPTGLVIDHERNPFRFLAGLVRRYGDFVRYATPYSRHHYLINDPETIRRFLQDETFERTSLIRMALGNGILASDGALWRGNRRRVQPSLTRTASHRFDRLVVERTEALLERWTRTAGRGRAVDLNDEMARVTLDIVVRALFRCNLGEDDAPLRAAVCEIVCELGAIGVSAMNIPYTVRPGGNRPLQEAVRVLDRVVYRLIDERAALPPAGDLLGRLLFPPGSAPGLTRRELHDELVTLVIGGHETSAQILAWTFLLLDRHPAARERLRDEAAHVLGDRSPGVGDLPALEYTRAVFREAMRLYPPVWFFVRRAREETELGGYGLPAGSTVTVCTWLTHRHPRYWRHPDRFDPERFLGEPDPPRPKFAYFPFGGGRHVCAGEHFAMMEAVLLLALVSRRFRVVLIPGQSPQPMPAIALRPDQPILARLEGARGGAR